MRKPAFRLAAGAAALILCGVPARGAPAPCLGEHFFWAARPFKTGSGSRAMTVGDFNGDNLADLAVAGYEPPRVSILLGTAGGDFAEAVNVVVGQGPVSVATGDLNGDGKADLVTANDGERSLSVLLGNGAGGFPGVQGIALGLSPTAVALADFNGDGKVDVAVATTDYEANPDPILVLLGTGTGGFMPAQTVASGHDPRSLTAADFNGDGKADLAVANAASDSVTVLLGNGSGGFSAAEIAVGDAPQSVATADLNGDGKADLVTANQDSDDVSVRLGTGTGSFSPATQFAAGDQPGFVTIADVNGDGKPDIATANGILRGVSVLLGTGTGSFALRDRLLTDGDPRSLVARDFDTDGKVDLAVADSWDVVLLRGLDAGFVTAPSFDAAGWAVAVAVGDLNGDGKPDLVLANNSPYSSAREFAVLLGLGAGHFGKATPVSVWSGFPTAVAVADVNGDGKLDVVTTDVVESNPQPASTTNGNASVFLGNGAGGFADPRHFGVGFDPQAVVTADFNGDGNIDLAVANFGSLYHQPTRGTLSILLGNGTGDFAPATNLDVAGYPHSIVAGDFNGDGHADLATANSYADTVSVRLGTGSGTFAPATDYGVGTLPWSVASADFNGDGHLDLAVGNLDSFDLSILLGTGTGQFGPAVSLATPGGVYAVAVGDFNGDARADLAVTGGFGSVLLGTGTGAFSPLTSFVAGDWAKSLAVADLNGDGKPDLAVAGEHSHNVSVLLNTIDGCPVSGLFISDVVLTEGNAGTASASFTVTLAPVNTQTVEVHFESAADSATAPSDYTHVSGLLSYAAGESTRTVTVDVNGDAEDEANETFFVNLSNPSSAALQDAQGQATIVNDDSPISDPAPVYRLLHPRIGAYLFTIFPHERDMAVLAYGYIYEGICCRWFLDAAGDGRTPLYRLYSAGAGEYFYTIYPEERDGAVQQYGYVYEGVSAYCQPQGDVAAPLPWYRLRYGNKHFFTIYASERDSAVQQYGYTYEGVACFLPPF